jgi:hypothetical protein
MTYEQAKALVGVQNELEEERRKAERRGAWSQSSSHSGVDLLLGVLGKIFK